MLAAWFRLVYAGVLLVAVSHLVGVHRLLGDDGYLAAFKADQLQAQALSGIHTFGDVFGAGLLLFGLHLLVVGYLAYRSGYVPRVLAMVLAVAGLGYLVDSVAAISGFLPSRVRISKHRSSICLASALPPWLQASTAPT